ncbi:hypothetical protein [Tenacibaculum sp. 190524A02b]|uniref:hypothetical protein n=1 Tax=Tenacibaculum vairaonense TaxID=3137860 RepID=UPI0031FB866F
MNLVKKINKYLLEHYPLIWNTRLLWMVLVGTGLHLLFFMVGYFTVNTQQDISQYYSLESFYKDTSVVFVSILFSIIILLIWIVYYLKNNAFKSFYQLKKGTLFIQFSIMVFIFFMNITQYYSFRKGLTVRIKQDYDWKLVDKDIKAFNTTALFLIQKSRKYAIENKQYPKPFPLYTVDDSRSNLGYDVDTTKAFIKHENKYYQFYELDKNLIKEEKLDTNLSLEEELLEEENNFKYRIVKDVSKYKNHIEPTLFNYSGTLYGYGQDSLIRQKRLKYYEKILYDKDEKAIKENLNTFLKLAEKYKIKNNLNVEDWYQLLDNENYTIREFIFDSKPDIDEVNRLAPRYQKILKTRKEYVEPLGVTSIPYCDLGNSDFLFKNIHSAYFGSSSKELLYIYTIFAFVFSLLLFLFKVTNIKTLLLSFVVGSVVLIFTIFVSSYVSRYNFSMSNNSLESIIVLFICILIVILSLISFALKWRKLITAILFSLALFAAPAIYTLLISLYSKYIRRLNLEVKDPLMEWLEAYWFWLVLVLWIISIAFYSVRIRQWKAEPE